MDKVVRAKDFMGQLVLGAVLEHPVLVLVVDLSREDNRLIWDILKESMSRISMATSPGSSKVIGNEQRSSHSGVLYVITNFILFCS
jgi:hypothetical protein